MKTIYVKCFADDDVGDVDAFFDVIDNKLTLITAWSNNDAEYRDEYMKSLFLHLKVRVVELPKTYD